MYSCDIASDFVENTLGKSMSNIFVRESTILCLSGSYIVYRSGRGHTPISGMGIAYFDVRIFNKHL